MSTKSFKKNFSLIELLAVIAIMSMLIAIVGAAMKPNPVNSAARELSGAINKARSYALAKRKYTLVHITQKEGKFAQIEPIEIYTDAGLSTLDPTLNTIPGSTTIYLNKASTVSSKGGVSSNADFDSTNYFMSFQPNGSVNISGAVTGAVILAESGKYYIDIVSRRDSDNNHRLEVNKYTGMTSFEE